MWEKPCDDLVGGRLPLGIARVPGADAVGHAESHDRLLHFLNFPNFHTNKN